MAFSIESIRKLNQIHLIAIGIPQKETRIAGGEPWQPDPGHPWKVSLYGGANLTLGGTINYEDPLQNLVSKITGNRLVHTAMSLGNKFGGIAPQIDIAKHYLYTGVNNLTFNTQGVLLLENNVVEDFFVPIEKLSYLAFPDRRTKLAVGDWIKKASDGLSKILQDNFGLQYSLTDSAGAMFNLISSTFSKEGITTDAGKGWQNLMNFMNGITGTAYSMSVPPTFDFKKAGSGLDFRYGSVLISDVFIKSMSFSVPKLYYQGGFPAAINVQMQLETMRPLTATAMTKIMMAQQQAWEGGTTVELNGSAAQQVLTRPSEEEVLE